MVKSNPGILLGVVLACLVYFSFILPRSCSFQLVAISYGLFHILYKKVKASKARRHLKTLEKVEANKTCKKMKARKACQKMKARKACKARKKMKARKVRKKMKGRKARKK